MNTAKDRDSDKGMNVDVEVATVLWTCTSTLHVAIEMEV
jgi:hypothetical protein